MPKTVGVITLHNSPNYGSCLQAFATQKVLSELGMAPLIIDYYRHDAIPENETERALNGQLAKKMPVFKVPGVKALAHIPVSRIVRRRAAPLNAFRRDYLALTKRHYYSYQELVDNPPQADIYCTGSDQVWNSTWNNGFDPAFFLGFAPDGSKKIAYAASIGKSSLEDWEREPMRVALSEYSHISVREAEAAELLDSIGIPGAVPVIDPTLMLDKDGWSRLASGEVPSVPYLLVYQLNRSHEFDACVQRLSKKTGLPAYRIAYGSHERRRGERMIVAPAVGRFAQLFLHAEVVVTDSFHGTAFSLNLGKRFVSISPGRFSGRIVNVLEMTGESDRYLKDCRDVGIVDEPIDWPRVQGLLEAKRQEARSFLIDAMGN